MVDAGSNNLLQALLSHSADLMLVVDPEGRRLFVSPSVVHVTGRTVEDLGGDNDVFTYIHPDDQEKARAYLAQRQADSDALLAPLVLRYQHADGRWLRLELVGRNLLKHPEIGGILIHVRDITAQLEAEEALEKEQRRYQALIEASADLTAIFDDALQISYVSPAVGSQLGYDPASLQGRSLYDYVHPEDSAVLRSALQSLLSGESTTARAHARVRHADGSWRILAASGRDLRNDPAVRGIVVNARDVTDQMNTARALKESELRFRLMVEGSMHIFFFSRDESGRITYLSPSVSNVLGYEPVDLLGQPYDSLLHEDEDSIEVQRIVDQAIEGGDPAPPYRIQVYRQDGSRAVLEIIEGPVDHEESGTVMIHGFARDVTPEVEAEAQYKNARRLQSILLDGIPDPAWLSDHEGRFLNANRAYQRAVGKTADQLIGQTVRSAYADEEFADYVEETNEQVLASGVPLRMEHPSPRDSERWFETVKTPLRDGDDRPLGIVGISRDVTQRRGLENALAESAARFQEMASHIHGVFYLLDARDHRYLYASPAFARIFGRPPTEVYADFTAILSFIHEEDAARAGSALQPLLEGKSIIHEYRVVLPDGSVRWVRDRAYPIFDEDGEVARICGTVEDINELKVAEEARRVADARYRALAEQSADIISILGPDGVRHYTSPSVKSVLGYSPESILGLPVFDIIHPDDLPGFQAQIDRLLAGADAPATSTLEYRARHASGAWRVMEATIRDLRGDSDVGGILHVSRDITRRRLAEEKIVEIEGELQNLMMTDDVTGIANHRGFLSFGDRHIRIARRMKHPTALLKIRLENLSSINEAHGHDAGDEALRAFAGVLKSTFRDTDEIARIGGATFAVLAMVRTTHDISIAADRLMQRLAIWNIEHPFVELRIRLRGAATTHKPKRTLRDLLSEAEERFEEWHTAT